MEATELDFMLGSWRVTGWRGNPDQTTTTYDLVLRVSPTVWMGQTGFREEWYSTAASPVPDQGVTVRLYDRVAGRWVSRWETEVWTPLIWPETAVLTSRGDSVTMSLSPYSDLTGDHEQAVNLVRVGQGWVFDGQRAYAGTPPFVWEHFEAEPLIEEGPWRPDHAGEVSTLLEGFSGSRGMAMDATGSVYVAARLPRYEGEGTPILKVAPDGTITTVADGGLRPAGLAWSGGSLYAKSHDDDGARLIRIDGTGQVEVVARVPGDVLTMDRNGTAYTTAANDPRVYRVLPDGTVTLLGQHPDVAGTFAMAFDPDRDLLYLGKWATGELNVMTSDGTLMGVTRVPGLGSGNIAWMAYAQDHLYVTGFSSQLILRVDPASGASEWIAGDGMPGGTDGPLGVARFHGPNGIAVTPDGATIYVAELRQQVANQYPSGRLRRIVLRNAVDGR